MTEPSANVELRGLTKYYGDLAAVDNVSLAIRSGEVTAIVGENGAGKSTLVKILAGVVQPTSGQILMDHSPVKLKNAREAAERGIGMVFQEMALVPSLEAWENIALGWETATPIRLDRAACIARVDSVSSAYRLPIQPRSIVGNLPVSIQQRIEILKVLYREANIVILDEPTGILTPQESEGLFEAIEKLRSAGKAVVFISHKLNEVLRIADTIHVMRRGKLVASTEPGEMLPSDLASLMLGEKLPAIEKAPTRQLRGLALRINGLEVHKAERGKKVGPICEELRYGEVLGIAGVAGSGQDEVVAALSGQQDHSVGVIEFHHPETDEVFTYPSRAEGLPQVLASMGVQTVPSDRNGTATVPSQPLWFSAAGSNIRDRSLYRGPILDLRRLRQRCLELFRLGNVAAKSPDQRPGDLSGGNLQKFIVAREMSHEPVMMIMEEPTRGIDVGSAYRIRRNIRDLAESGGACLVISSDLDEIFQICDRIVVMYDGQSVGSYAADEVTIQTIGAAMTGLREE